MVDILFWFAAGGWGAVILFVLVGLLKNKEKKDEPL